MKNDKKNLLVIGNGFDLSLGLNSKFQNYIDDEENIRLVKAHQAFNNILNIFNTFSKRFNKITRSLNDKELSFSIKKMLNKNGSHLRFEKISPFLSNTYLIIKAILPNFSIDNSLFNNIHGYSVNHISSELDTLCCKYEGKLQSYVSRIDVDIWELLILSYEENNEISYKKGNWYDVENIVKVFITSVLDLNSPSNTFKSYEQYFSYNPSMNSLFKSSLLINDDVSFIEKLQSKLANIKKLQSKSKSKEPLKLSLPSFITSFMSYITRQNSGYLVGNTAFKSESAIAYVILNGPYFKFEQNSSYLSFLRNQLKLFEKHFNNYLVKTIDCYNERHKSSSPIDSCYVDNSFKLLRMLSNGTNFNVLDFNYTLIKSNDSDCIIRHIHGKLHKQYNLKDHIIIGIANKDIWPASNYKDYSNNVDKLYTFSKAYQIMNSSSFNNQINSSFFKNIDSIVFFGQSFSYNDYSYFEALFDKFNLYDSNVKLVFCYTKHGSKSIDAIKNKQVKKVIKLLRHYGQSMENKEHGKNLIPKLILDNRLEFKNIKI